MCIRDSLYPSINKQLTAKRFPSSCKEIKSVRFIVDRADTPVSYTHLDVYKRQIRCNSEADSIVWMKEDNGTQGDSLSFCVMYTALVCF